MQDVKGGFSEHLSQCSSTVLGHFSCQELKAFSKTREGHLKGQYSTDQEGSCDNAENQPHIGEGVRSAIISDGIARGGPFP